MLKKIEEIEKRLDNIESCTCKKKNTNEKLKKKMKKGLKRLKAYWTEPICKG